MANLPVKPEFDEYGLLTDPTTWTPELAELLAEEAGIGPLTEDHWAFVNSLREYYLRYQAPPPPHKVCHDLHMPHSYGHQLFDTCLTAWRIAGLPDPGEEAKAYLSAA